MRRVRRLVLRCARRASRSGLVGLIAERQGVPRGRLKEDTLQKQSEIPRVPPVSVEGCRAVRDESRCVCFPLSVAGSPSGPVQRGLALCPLRPRTLGAAGLRLCSQTSLFPHWPAGRVGRPRPGWGCPRGGAGQGGGGGWPPAWCREWPPRPCCPGAELVVAARLLPAWLLGLCSLWMGPSRGPPWPPDPLGQHRCPGFPPASPRQLFLPG